MEGLGEGGKSWLWLTVWRGLAEGEEGPWDILQEGEGEEVRLLECWVEGSGSRVMRQDGRREGDESSLVEASGEVVGRRDMEGWVGVEGWVEMEGWLEMEGWVHMEGWVEIEGWLEMAGWVQVDGWLEREGWVEIEV